MIVALALAGPASGFVEAMDPCGGNLVFVGTVAPGAPEQREGRGLVRWTLSVDLALVDLTGDAEDGEVEVVLPDDERNGEVPDLAVGERWSMALNRVAGHPDALLLGHAWSRVPTDARLPVDPLRRLWALHCSEGAVRARATR